MLLTTAAMIAAVSTSSAPHPHVPHGPATKFDKHVERAFPARGIVGLQPVPYIDPPLRQFWFWVWFSPLPDAIAPPVGECFVLPLLRETICEKGCQP